MAAPAHSGAVMVKSTGSCKKQASYSSDQMELQHIRLNELEDQASDSYHYWDCVNKTSCCF